MTLNRKRLHGAIERSIACLVLLASASPALFAQTRAVWSATPVAQSNGNTVTMPLKRPVSRSSKLSLTIDTRWSQNYGYRPVEVTIRSPKPVTADRAISIRLNIRTGWRGLMKVDQEFTLLKGSTSATATIAVPQYQMATPFYWWDVRVDGVKDNDLSLKKEDAYGVMQSGYSASSGASFLAMTIKSGQRSLVAPNSMEFEVLSLAAAEFPRRWIDYTCLDAITLSLDELVFLQELNPEAFQSLRRWVRAGGQLWVNDVGDEFQRLPELCKLLQLDESVAPEVKAGADAKTADDAATDAAWVGWRPVRFVNGNPEGQVVTFMDHTTGQTRTVRDADVIARLQYDSNFSMVSQRYESGDENPVPQTSGDSSRWFIEQPMGLGLVRAFRETNDVSLFQQSRPAVNANAAANQTTSEDLPPSLRSALQSVGRWSARHGMAPDDASLDFANLLVPGMGLAPVNEFRILITLFVLLIGPANYWLLRRWRRLHLMVLTVPLAAAIVTFALFAYAIVADGFGTTVRAHSYTTVDQRTGETACWARLSYYSGLAPRAGLTMPTDVAMYPIVPGWNGGSIDAHVNSKRDLRWEPDEARLSRGWLRSRTPTQYLTVRARKSPLRLELQPVRERMRVKNELGARIEYVVVVDDANKMFAGEKLHTGEVGFLQPMTRSEAVNRFRKIVTANLPQTPEALAGENSNYSAMQRRQWQMYRGRYTGFTGEHSLEGNLTSQALASLAGVSGKEGLTLPPRSYVAITATGPEVVFGMEGVDEEASFHVVVGRW